MRIKAQALAALLLLCLPAISGARGDAPRENPLQQAKERLAIGGAGYGDFLFVRRLVIAHPEICHQRYWTPGVPNGSSTLLIFAASACSDACFRRSVGGASDIPDAEATLRLILAKTDTGTLIDTDRASGASALEAASRDTAAMDMLYARFRKARRIPDLNRILYDTATGSGSPDLRAIRWLMAHGANPRWQDSQGYTIIQRAQQEGLSVVASTLQGN